MPLESSPFPKMKERPKADATHAACCGKPDTCSDQPSSRTKTKLVIKFDCGFSNNLTIRGQGANLSWTKGIPLKNVKADEWVFETDVPFTKCEYKVLINDTIYESGPNRTLASGTQSQYTPRF